MLGKSVIYTQPTHHSSTCVDYKHFDPIASEATNRGDHKHMTEENGLK